MAAGDYPMNPERQRRKATLSDVARAANVSLSTASKALRNQERISPETRARVHQAAHELSYTPNSFAQSLVSGRSHTIGIITQDLQGRFCTPALIGAERILGEEKTSIMLVNAHGRRDLERTHIRGLLSHNIEGIIAINPETNPRPPLDFDLSIPTVYAYAPSLSEDDCSITCDNVGAGRMVARHLIEDAGRKRIAFIGGVESFDASKDRLEGTLAELRAHGLELVSPIRFGSWSETWGREATSDLLHSGVTFDAVICQNDQIARGCIEMLMQRGLSVPDDVAVTGHDDWDIICQDAPIPITSASNEVEKIGARAATMLVDAINGQPHHGTTYIPCKLYPRASTIG